jgi:hypothetical protein
MANGTLAASQLEMLTLSGTGVITIVPPNTNTNRTLTLPDSTGTVATAQSTLTQFSASGSAPVFAARAWVNFDGTGTVAIRASGNVSSITDNGTGDYTVNFTTAMPDANYAVTNGSCDSGGNTNAGILAFTSATASAFRANLINVSGTLVDRDRAMLAFAR